MKEDEALYAQAGTELANNPNKGLLVKCTTQFPNDPNQAQAEYVKVRVEQMKKDIVLEIARETEELAKKRERDKEEAEERRARAPISPFYFAFVTLAIIAFIFLALMIAGIIDF